MSEPVPTPSTATKPRPKKVRRLKSMRQLFAAGHVRFRWHSAIKRDPLYAVVLRKATGEVSVAEAVATAQHARTLVNAWNERTDRHGFTATAHKLNLRGCIGPERKPVDLGPPPKPEETDDADGELQDALEASLAASLADEPLFAVVMVEPDGKVSIVRNMVERYQADAYCRNADVLRPGYRLEVRAVDLSAAIVGEVVSQSQPRASDLGQGGAGIKPRYVVRIIELDDDPSKATVDPEPGFESDDLGEAKLWASEFNEGELEDRLGVFAVVQRCESAATTAGK